MAMAAGSAHFLTTLSGVQMPRMIYGTAWKEQRTADLVERAVLAGFRGIDTACQPKHYQEELVGAAIAKVQKVHGIPRTDLFLQTKYTPEAGQDPKRIPYDPRASLPEQVSAAQLNTSGCSSCIDLLSARHDHGSGSGQRSLSHNSQRGEDAPQLETTAA